MEQPESDEQLWRGRVDDVSDWIWEVDTDGVFTYSNAVVRQTLDYAPDQVIGKTIFDLIAPEHVNRCMEILRAAREGGEWPRNMVARFVTSSGGVKSLETGCVPIADAEGVVMGCRGVTRDVSERDALQQCTGEALANYKAVTDNSPVGIIIVQDGRIVYGNPVITARMGYAAEDVTGLAPWKLIHPEDRERVMDYYSRRMAGEESPAEYEIRAITKSGELRVFELRATVVDYNGAPAVLDTLVDITDRKRWEQAIQESEEKYRDLVENVSDWVWEVNERGEYTYVSPRVRQLLGYEAEEVLGRTYCDLMSPRESRRVMELVAPGLAAHEPIRSLVNTLVRKDGSSVIVETSGEPIFDGDGAFRGYRGMDRDISEQEHARDALRARTAELEAVFDAFADLYFWLDPDGRIVDYRACEKEALFVSPEEFLGKNMSEVLPSDAGDLIVAAIAHARATGEPETIEYALPFSEGHRCFEFTTALLPTGYAMGIAREITERKRAEDALRDSEAKYKNLVETTDTGYLIVDAEGRVVDANAEYVRLTGYSKLEDIRGRTVLEWTAPYDFARNAEAVRKCTERGLVRDLEIDYISPDGRIIPIEINATVIETSDGRRILTLCRDISERRSAESRRRAFERRLAAQQRKFYRETILSVTGGRLEVCDRSRLKPFMSGAQVRMTVDDAYHVSEARQGVERFCSEAGLAGDRLDCYMIGAGEAITNAIKHAARGQVYAGLNDDSVWVGVEDHGSGIGSLILPRATLLRGFSTKPSLGLGYSIMIEVSDKILLNTGGRGTTVILVKKIQESAFSSCVSLPDTWESIPG